MKPQRLDKIERSSVETQAAFSIPHGFSNPAFTQAVRIPAAHDLIVIGLQFVDAERPIWSEHPTLRGMFTLCMACMPCTA